MTSKTRYALTIGLVILLIALFAVGIFVYRRETKKVTILDFSRNITYSDRSNYQISAGDIKETEILAVDMRDDYITDEKDAVGKYLSATALEGQHVLKGQLSVDPTYTVKAGNNELSGSRKIYLPINYASAFAGDIESGQLVDILFTESANGYPTDRTEDIPNALTTGVKYYSAKIIMQSVPVYQVYTANGSVYHKPVTDPKQLKNADGGTNSANIEPAYVALTVTVPQYEELAARQQLGTLSLVSRFDESSDVDTTGHTIVKDEGAAIYHGEGSLEYSWDFGSEDGETADTEAKAGTYVAQAKPETKKVSIYEFINTLQKFDLSESQRNSFRSVFSRYQDYMTQARGEDWSLNNPETVTDEELSGLFSDEKLEAYNTWKKDLEKLAKEVQGSDVKLPW